jgi:hypothetical protein
VSTFAQSGAARGDNNSRIGYYRFMVYGDDHQRAEDLGIRDMRDDADAQSFGYRVIRDLMQTDARSYFGWTMDITARNRAVVSIPFDAVETRH